MAALIYISIYINTSVYGLVSMCELFIKKSWSLVFVKDASLVFSKLKRPMFSKTQENVL